MIVLVNHNNTTARYIFGMGNMCLKGCGWKEAIVWVEWGLKLDLFRSLPCTLFMNKWFHHYFCDRKKSMKVLQSAIFYKLLRIKNVIYDFCFLGSQKLPPSRPLPIQTHPPPPPAYFHSHRNMTVVPILRYMFSCYGYILFADEKYF